MRNKNKWNLCLSIVSAVIAVFFLEFFCGILFDRLPQKFNNGKRIVQSYMGQPLSIPSAIESHPYLLYQNTKSYYTDGFLQHNSLRYRNQEFSIEKDPAIIRILVLGGSTTYMFPYIQNPKNTWVAQLETRLRQEISQNFQVINAGQSYATTAELLSSYVFRHRYLHPDILIIHEGANDIAALMFDHYDPEYAHFRSHGSGLNPRTWERTLLLRCRFFQLVYAIWLNDLETVYKSQPSGFRDLKSDEVQKRVTANNSEGFRRNLDALIRYAQADGVKVVLFGFVQAREGFISKNRLEFKGLEKSWVIGLEKHNRIMEDLSVQYNIPFLKPSQSLFKDEWFQDNCHLNEQGESLKADILYEFFMSRQNEYFLSGECDHQ